MKENDFLCPQCRGQLKPNNKIVFSVKTKNGSVGLMLLSPHLGEYSVVKHKLFKLNDGEHLEVYCPICHENLGDQHEHKDLAKVLMINGEDKEYEIVFSLIVGQKCTYKVLGEDMEPFGEDADEYFNFWGEAPTY